MQAIGKKPNRSSRSRAARAVGALLSILTMGLCAVAANAQTPPAVVVSQVSFVGALTGGYTSGNNGNPAGGSFAVDQNGDVLVGGTYSGNVDVFNGVTGAATKLSGVGGGGVSIDGAGNLYVPQVYGSTISKIPYSNGYSTANKTTINTSGIGVGIKASAFDAAGDLFLVTVPSQTTGASQIYEITAANLSGSAAATLIYSDTLSVTSIALDPWGNLFFVDDNFATQVPSVSTSVAFNLANGVSSGSYLYELAGTTGGTYTGSPVLLKSLIPPSPGTYDNVISGLVADAGGTVYYSTQNDGVFAFPNNGTAFSSGSLPNFYTVSTFGGKGLANDNKGNIYVITYNNGDCAYRVLINNVVVPGGAIGVASSTTSGAASAAAATGQVQIAVNDGSSPVLAVTASENGATTGEFSVTPGTGVAAPVGSGTLYPATVSMTAAFVGERNALFTLSDTANGGSGKASVTGIGQGALATLDPGVGTAYATGFTSPQSISADAAGDLFVTDSGKLYEIASGSTTPTAVASGLFNEPTATAFDANGNLYIADGTANSIFEIASGSTTATTLVASTVTFGGTALKTPEGLAVGPDGTLYIADTGNNRVVAYSLNSGFTGVYATALDTPVGLAVDAAGDVYVANNGSTNPGVLVYQGGNITAAPYLPTGVTLPWGIAVDASGSLLVADTATGAIVRIPYETPKSGTPGLNLADAVTIETNPKSAYGLALDSSGNLYTTDSAGKAVYAITRSAASINFGDVATGSTATDLLYVEDAGNAALNTPTVATSPASPFTLAAGGASACGAGSFATSVAAGYLCEFSAGFTAPASGSPSATASLAFTNGQEATAGVTLTGTATAASGTSPNVIIFTPLPASITYSSTPIPVYAVATSGLPVTITVTGPAAYASGELTLTGFGKVTVTASQAGNSTYVAATPVSYTIQVAAVGVAATPVFSLAGSTYTFVPQSTTITDSTPGAIIYYTVTPGATGTTPTTASPVYSGPISITSTETIETLAVAPGYNPSAVASSTYTISVQPAAFTVAFNSPTLSIPSQQAGAINVIVAPTNGFNSTVTLSVSGLPSNATSSFTPPTLALSGGQSGTSVLTISLSPSAALHRDSNPLFPGAVLATILCFIGFRKRRDLLQLVLLLTAGVISLGMLSGCSSSSTKPTASTVTVTATSGTVVESATFSLTVTPK